MFDFEKKNLEIYFYFKVVDLSSLLVILSLESQI